MFNFSAAVLNIFGCISREMVDCFHTISHDKDCRAVVVSGAGKMFTSGRPTHLLGKH